MSTTPAEAKKIVLVGVAGSTVLASVATARRGSVPAQRIVIGGFISAVALAAIAEFVPPIAAGLAGLMLVTSVFVLSGDAMEGISAITAPSK